MFEQKGIDQLFDDGLFIVRQLLDFFKLPEQLDIAEGLDSLLICGAVHQEVGRYAEGVHAHDKRGNLQTITRRGLHFDGSAWQEGQIDNLTFDYHNTGSSNRLQKVTDAATGDFAPHGFVQNGTGDYTYDANGNLERDPHKGINIAYNYLNLPQTIAYDDGRVIEWTYDAAGTKLRKTTFSSILELHDDPIAPVLQVISL